MRGRVLAALLGLACFVFLVAPSGRHEPSSLIFGDNSSTTLTLWSWGSNANGQLGDGTFASKTTPTQESGEANSWSAIAAGYDHTVALRSDGTLWAWGSNISGQLGDGTTVIKTIPIQESTGANDWSAIAAGANHTVALKIDGTLWAWGSNGDGQLGDGTRADKTAPTQELTGTTSWSAIAAGFHLTVALRSDGTLWAWGSNNDGQIGDGSSQGEVITPSQESTGATSWSTIAAGDQHALALRSDGSLWAWGENGDRRLGVDTAGNKNNPTQESTKATNWTAVAAGRGHSVALNSDSPLSSPTPIPAITGWGLVALGALLLVMTALSLRRVAIL